MHPIPWYVMLFQSIPESFLILILGFALFNLEIEYKNALLISLISAVGSYFVRKLPLIFGVHTLLGIGILVIIAIAITKIKPFQVLVSILAGLVTIALTESILMSTYFNVIGVTLQCFISKPWLHILFFLPEAIIISILYIIVKKYRLYIFDLRAGEQIE